MRKYKALSVVLSVVLTLTLCLPSAQAAPGVVRAMLVGCGAYAYPYVSLGETPLKDVDLMLRTLIMSGISNVSRYKGITKSALLANIKKDFAGAGPNDTAYFYFSGHGEMRSGQSVLVLSDGKANSVITAAELEAALSAIPGTKVLIIDACHSGGFVAKSVGDSESSQAESNEQNQGQVESKQLESGLSTPFRKSEYKVLVAASLYEYAWSSQSYSDFTYALAEGLAGINGRYMADYNANGAVTLAELYDWVYARNRSSKAQVYPQSDSRFKVVSYKLTDDLLPKVSNFYGRQVVTSETIDKPVSVYFTTRTQCYVEIVLEKSDDKNSERQLYKTLSRKQYEAGKFSYTLTGEEVLGLEEGGYALTLIVGPERELETYTYYFEVRKNEPIRIGMVLDREVFSVDGVSEMAIRINFITVCAITLEIKNAAGERVRRLAIDDEARPTHYPDHTELLFFNQYYWDGRNDKGELLPAGVYTITASANGSLRGNAVTSKIFLTRQ